MWRTLLKIFCLVVMLGVSIVATVELWTLMMSQSYSHANLNQCSNNRVAVVLGCSKYFISGKPNSYFHGRMSATATLWRSGKIRGVIVSGDNSDRYYNEPRDMREALVKLGVPDDKIVSDFAGLCTYDSVVRAQRIFGAKRLIFISQPEHVARAVAIARGLGMDAEGYQAPLHPVTRRTKLHQFIRERGARIAMAWDVILRRDPHHLGQPQPLPF